MLLLSYKDRPIHDTLGNNRYVTFQVHTHLSMKSTVALDLKLCSFIPLMRRNLMPYPITWKRRQHVRTKRWQIPTTLYGVTFQNTETLEIIYVG